MREGREQSLKNPVPEGSNYGSVFHCVKFSRKVNRNKDRGERGCFGSVELLRDSKEDRLC